MAPATLAGATPRAAQVRGRWDRDSIIDAMRAWVATYGEPPRAADRTPSAQQCSGQPWRVARYRAGRADGTPWPALNSAKRPFGGSLAAAIRAAGFGPAKPGPKRRAGVDHEQAQRVVISPEGRAMIAAALDRARTAERALERARDRGERLARERDAARAGARRARRDGAAAAVGELRPELAAARDAARRHRRGADGAQPARALGGDRRRAPCVAARARGRPRPAGRRARGRR